MTVADRVFESVRSDIISGAIPRNEMMSIYQLAEKYDVSRTPVREAVLRLANVGLVVVEKNHGVRIRGLTSSDLREIFQTRILIEVPSAYYAAGSNPPGARERFVEDMGRLREAAERDDLAAFIHADRALHSTIISWNGNTKAAKIVNQIRDESHSLGASTFEEGRNMLEVLDEHVPIYDAILKGEEQLAAQRMHQHLVQTARLLLAAKTAADEGVEDDVRAIESMSPVIFIGL